MNGYSSPDSQDWGKSNGSSIRGGNFAPAATDSILHFNGQSGEVSWDVTADVLSGEAVHGWLIKKTREGQAGRMQYYSREGATAAGDPNLGPRLILEYAQ